MTLGQYSQHGPLTQRMTLLDVNGKSVHQSDFNEVFSEIRKEKKDQIIGNAKVLYEKALELKTQRDQKEQDFLRDLKKFDDEIVKVLDLLQKMIDGKMPFTGVEPDTDTTEPQSVE